MFRNFTWSIYAFSFQMWVVFFWFIHLEVTYLLLITLSCHLMRYQVQLTILLGASILFPQLQPHQYCLHLGAWIFHIVLGRHVFLVAAPPLWTPFLYVVISYGRRQVRGQKTQVSRLVSASSSTWVCSPPEASPVLGLRGHDMNRWQRAIELAAHCQPWRWATVSLHSLEGTIVTAWAHASVWHSAFQKFPVSFKQYSFCLK